MARSERHYNAPVVTMAPQRRIDNYRAIREEVISSATTQPLSCPDGRSWGQGGGASGELVDGEKALREQSEERAQIDDSKP